MPPPPPLPEPKMEDIIKKGNKYMDRLPTVVSCCFCCFLRAGTVCIAMVSFIFGILFASNVTQKSPSSTDMLHTSSSAVETGAQMVLGVASIVLCILSILLLCGAMCNIPKFIEYYQWGAIGYCLITVLVYITLAFNCFIVAKKCVRAGVTLLFLIAPHVVITAYFVIVVNSLRMTILYLNRTLVKV